MYGVKDLVPHLPPHKQFKVGNFAHAAFPECESWIKALKPKRCYLVGMGCGIGDHDEANAEIKRRGYSNVELAYDGMVLEGLSL